MGTTYHAIVVGARCAGSPVAMLLARKGYRVLLLDRARFPSDTISSHVIHPPGVAALSRWGILEQLTRTGCPPVDTYVFDFGPFAISGSPGTPEYPVAYCPRRTVLDAMLVEAASQAGAEVRESFTVQELLFEDGRVAGVRGHSKDGASVTELAAVVVGADGRHSFIASATGARAYNEKPPLEAAYYCYWSGLPTQGRFEIFDRGDRGWGAAPTNDGLTLVIAGWPYSEFEVNKHDVERYYLEVFDREPRFAARIREARRETRISGAAISNYFRTPYGPGWALVGDAGYNKDPITAQGITDAFRDAERCAAALDEWLACTRKFDEAMADYQRERDARVFSMYEFTCQMASLQPPPPETRQLLQAVAGSRRAMDAFVQMNAGTISPAEFFSPEHLRSILPDGQPAG